MMPSDRKQEYCNRCKALLRSSGERGKCRLGYKLQMLSFDEHGFTAQGEPLEPCPKPLTYSDYLHAEKHHKKPYKQLCKLAKCSLPDCIKDNQCFIGDNMSTTLEFYKEKIENFESMTFEERRAAVTDLNLDDKQHCKSTLKAVFRVKPAKDAVSDYSFKNGFGKHVDCYTLSQCVPMKALSKKPRSSAQKAAALKLAEASRKESSRNAAALKALQAVNGGDLVCIDTETTDLNGHVIQIAVVCVKTAQVLFDSYVKATEDISPEAFNVHGISEGDISDAPSFEQVAKEISKIIGDREWTAFNIEFDYQSMINSAHDKNAKCYEWLEQKSFCTMYDIAADFFGATNKYGSISLANAMAECGVVFEGKAHSASADAVATAKVIQYVANEAVQ